ncbi:MAG: VOC family protein [Nitriliruptoraceae bacterium]
MSHVRILQIDVPAPQLEAAVDFWAGALSATPRDAPGAFVHLVDARSAIEVHVQATGDPVARYHLDIEAVDRDAEVARLTGVGARELARFDGGYTVLHDPAGLALCVIDPDAATPTPVVAARGEHGHLDAIHLDVPGEHARDATTFWAALLGLPPASVWQLDGPGGTLALAVTATDAAAARLRVALSASEPAAEVDRLVGLGALRCGDSDGSTRLCDPAGNPVEVVARTRSPM